MQSGAICKTLSIILLVLELIGTFITAIAAGNAGWDFDFAAFLICLVVGVFVSLISTIPLYALGEIVDSLNLTNSLLYDIAYKKSDTASPAAPAPTPESNPTPRPFIKHDPGAGWLCSCGERNSSTSQFCKSCGKYK